MLAAIYRRDLATQLAGQCHRGEADVALSEHGSEERLVHPRSHGSALDGSDLSLGGQTLRGGDVVLGISAAEGLVQGEEVLERDASLGGTVERAQWAYRFEGPPEATARSSSCGADSGHSTPSVGSAARTRDGSRHGKRGGDGQKALAQPPNMRVGPAGRGELHRDPALAGECNAAAVVSSSSRLPDKGSADQTDDLLCGRARRLHRRAGAPLRPSSAACRAGGAR